MKPTREPGASDKRELARLRAADPARARVTELLRLARELTAEELDEVESWRTTQLARKAELARAAAKPQPEGT